MSAQVTERKFKKGYTRQYELLSAFWKQKPGISIDPFDLRFVFTRKFPKDVDQEIDTLVKGMGVLPLETLYGLMSFIENPQEEAEKFRADTPEMALINETFDAEEGAEGTPIPPDQPVQSTALNGAQIASLLKIVQEVAIGNITRETAEKLIAVSFPSITPEEIAALFRNVKSINAQQTVG